MAKCQTCGEELPDVSERFCGGDRCQRVFMRVSPGLRITNERGTKTSYFDNRRGVT